ncbi:MAG: TIM barrel protein [Terriglobales bacterium]|jgi:D-psicose/D-tagatose/L-ribulose 3-epimerase
MKYAVHAYSWTPSWSNKTLHLIDHVKELGLDAIEIPLMEPDLVDSKAIRKRLESVGLGVCTSVAVNEQADPTADDPEVRKCALEFLKRCVRLTAEMGGTVFTGVTYSAIGRRIPRRPNEEDWQRAAAALKEAARYAKSFGVTIGIEAINRYETFLINTAEQAVALMRMVDEPNVRVHLDAYHMNIEETDYYGATKLACPYLVHYHLSESHRGIPGRGRVDWDGIFRALGEARYEGLVGMESFPEISEAMTPATCTWRDVAPSSDILVTEGLRFLKRTAAKYYAS